MYNPQAFIDMASASPPLHFGVHTFSHSQMTGKTDMELLGELGWVSQIIYDVAGKVPIYWR